MFDYIFECISVYFSVCLSIFLSVFLCISEYCSFPSLVRSSFLLSNGWNYSFHERRGILKYWDS